MTQNEAQDLPPGWASAPIRHVLDALPDGSLVHQGWSPKCESEPAPPEGWGVLKTTAIQDGYFLPEHNKRLPDHLEPKPKLEVRDGDVLLTCAGPRVRCGVPTLVRRTRAKLLISGKMYRMRAHPDLLHPVFLEAFLRSSETQKKIDEMKTGISESGMNITHERFSTLDVPLPPFPEQVRIADKLDVLLARVDTGRERLERVPRLIKQFRQSVLSAAVSGELTREWRGGEVEWREATGNEVFSFVTSGSRGWAEYYSESGSIFLRIGNLEHHSIALDLRNIQHVNPPPGAEGIRTRVQINDILISITADVGMVAHVDKNIGEAYINQHICMARPASENNPRYLAYFLTAPNGGLEHLKKIQRGATKVGLTLGDIRGTTFRLPSRLEQDEIVRRIEVLFCIADRLETRYRAALSSFDRLTPALLAKAFRGELVPQDPNDEPASVLLERIRAQRASAPGKVKRGRQAKTSPEAGGEQPAKRRGRPRKTPADDTGAAPGIPEAGSYEEAVQLLEGRRLVRTD